VEAPALESAAAEDFAVEAGAASACGAVALIIGIATPVM
jgi:hypothetical protein